jgi:hypothetical protein
LRFQLHSLGADVREVLTIRRSGDAIEVIGVVSDSGRKQEIASQIGALSQVAFRLQTAQELQHAAHQTPALLNQGNRPIYDAPTKPWLQQQFPNAADRERFVQRALQLSRDISVRAYALSQLAERYPPAASNALSPQARSKINRIVADLAGRISEDGEALRGHVAPLVMASRAEPAPATWQSATARCLAVARRTDETLTNLFATSPQPPGDFNSLVEQLGSQLSAVCRIQTE